MKSSQRHKLKENEFARTVAHARALLVERTSTIRNIVIGLVALLAIVVALAWWRSAGVSAANEQLADALATYQMPVVPPAPPAPGSPPPLPRPGTFQSEEERLKASLPKFLEVAEAHPDTEAGITARFHAASILAAVGRHGEAEQGYREVIDKAGTTIYGRTARLGMAGSQVAQGKFDEAINVYLELSRETNSNLPVDSVLLQLGRTYARAGRKEEAVRSFTRLVDEFPQSPYATEARRELEETKKAS